MTRTSTINELADRLAALHRPHPIRVGIDGFAAAGKTTLADELVHPLQQRGRRVLRVSIDGFHNPAAIRHRRGRNCPQGYYEDSFDHGAVLSHVLKPLGPEGSRRYKTAQYDYRTNTALEDTWKDAPSDAILLFDGIFLHRPELEGHWDFTLFVDTHFDVILARACQRDRDKFDTPGGVRQRFEERFIPGSRHYLETHRPHERANIVVNNTDVNRPTLRCNPSVCSN